MNLYYEIDNNNYIRTLLGGDNKFIYKKNIFNKVNINNFDRNFNNHITNHNKKFDFYYINCSFELLIDQNRLLNIEINYHHNTDYINLRCYLYFYIKSHKIKNFIIKKMIINTISCFCNMSYKFYLSMPMPMLERRMNYIIAKNPDLINCLDRNKNHPLIKKYSHI